MTIVYILAAILIFGVLIAVHELGHFLAAKSCGVQVNEFSIGMGPCIWQRQKGETVYSLRALPIGGFCAMEGEDEESDNDRSLTKQGFWKQLLIFSAGALMNLLVGFLIILLLYSGAKGFYTAKIQGFAPEFSPQSGEASLHEGDLLYSIDGRRVLLYNDLELLLSLSKDETFDLVVVRDGKKVALNDFSLPRKAYTASNGETYTGYGLYFGDIVKATPLVKLRYAGLNTIDFARTVWLSLEMLVSGQASLNDVSGPVGIVSTITEVGQLSETVKAAMENILYLGALIAVNLCVMNLLPIPALDGGKIFFLVVDAMTMVLFRKKLPERYEAAIHMTGFVLLMGLMVIVTFHDVLKLFQ